MAIDDRCKDVAWKINRNLDGTVPSLDAHLAVLMDIRDELKAMNRVLHCPNFLGLPNEIRWIRQAAEKKSRRQKAVRQ